MDIGSWDCLYRFEAASRNARIVLSAVLSVHVCDWVLLLLSSPTCSRMYGQGLLRFPASSGALAFMKSISAWQVMWGYLDLKKSKASLYVSKATLSQNGTLSTSERRWSSS